MASAGGGDREHVHRLDCWCRPSVYLYCQYCEQYDDATQCFMCNGAHVFPMVAGDRKRLQELVDEGHDRPPLIVVHVLGSTGGAIELLTHIVMGQSNDVDGFEDDDDDDEGDDTDEPAEGWQKDPEAWKKNSG